MDHVRELLLEIAEAEQPPDFSTVAGHPHGSPEFERAAYHMKMLIDEVGLVRGIDVCSQDGDG